MLPRSGPPRIHADRSLSGVSPWSARARFRKAIMTVADGSLLLDDLRQRTSDRRRYQELFEFAPDGYIVSDGFGVIQEANQAALALLQERGAALAGRLGWPFRDADEFHPSRNIEKMRRGIH